jgi:hypothetical protein
LESYLSNWLEKHNLIELASKKISHPWCNGRKGDGMVEKNLDWFLISNSLIENRWGFYSRGEVGGLSNHFSIVLEILKTCL